MCSISVEPRPSRISTPKCSVQRLPMSAGSASPAEVQTRIFSSPRAGSSGLASSAAIQRGHAVEDRRLVLAQPREDRGRRGPLGHQHRRGADRQRKREAVAETVGEEQLRRREDDVVLADAEDRLRVELGGRDQARLHVHGAFRRAGRTRRIEPETGIVAGRRRRRERRARCRHQLGKRAQASGPCRRSRRTRSRASGPAACRGAARTSAAAARKRPAPPRGCRAACSRNPWS